MYDRRFCGSQRRLETTERTQQRPRALIDRLIQQNREGVEWCIWTRRHETSGVRTISVGDGWLVSIRRTKQRYSSLPVSWQMQQPESAMHRLSVTVAHVKCRLSVAQYWSVNQFHKIRYCTIRFGKVNHGIIFMQAGHGFMFPTCSRTCSFRGRRSCVDDNLSVKHVAYNKTHKSAS